ncbi:uncharacterized protein LOC134220431 [Armigeres subalbatus]|uniref:uncharacterized protein LOC134220431 n=1 Tax=Armigeres subalbatus TaxID=124917 RepID=UPI002ED25DE9
MKLLVFCLLGCALAVLVHSSPVPAAAEPKPELLNGEAAEGTDLNREKRTVGVSVGGVPALLPGLQPSLYGPPFGVPYGPAGLLGGPGIGGTLNSILAVPRNLINSVGWQLTSLG